MSGNGKVSPFPAAPGVPIVGQPFTILIAYVPANVTLKCNCGGGDDTTVAIVGSISATCAHCGREYNAAFNPITGKLDMRLNIPPKKDAS